MADNEAPVARAEVRNRLRVSRGVVLGILAVVAVIAAIIWGEDLKRLVADLNNDTPVTATTGGGPTYLPRAPAPGFVAPDNAAALDDIVEMFRAIRGMDAARADDMMQKIDEILARPDPIVQLRDALAQYYSELTGICLNPGPDGFCRVVPGTANDPTYVRPTVPMVDPTPAPACVPTTPRVCDPVPPALGGTTPAPAGVIPPAVDLMTSGGDAGPAVRPDYIHDVVDVRVVTPPAPASNDGMCHIIVRLVGIASANVDLHTQGGPLGPRENLNVPIVAGDNNVEIPCDIARTATCIQVNIAGTDVSRVYENDWIPMIRRNLEVGTTLNPPADSNPPVPMEPMIFTWG